MVSGVLGILAFGLALFAIGAFMDGKTARAGLYAGAFALCAVVVLATSSPRGVSDADCWVDWDGRTNSTVCD